MAESTFMEKSRAILRRFNNGRRNKDLDQLRKELGPEISELEKGYADAPYNEQQSFREMKIFVMEGRIE